METILTEPPIDEMQGILSRIFQQTLFEPATIELFRTIIEPVIKNTLTPLLAAQENKMHSLEKEMKDHQETK